jgi:TPR repeat protein
MDDTFAALWPRWQADPGGAELGEILHALAGAGHAAAAQALAVRAFEGHGGARDTAAAFAWALRAAHGGFAAGAAMAGDFLLHSEPELGACARLPERAVHWHDRAGLAGHARAALTASDSHRMGRGTARDFGRAWFFLRIALASFERPPPLTDILVPSLKTDLDAAVQARVDEEVEALLPSLPRADATLEGYWAHVHASAAEEMTA